MARRRRDGRRSGSAGAVKRRSAASATRRAQPPTMHTGIVLPEWIDYNGHMNLSCYVLLFDHATDAFLDRLGITSAYRRRHQVSTFSAEIHVNYLRELKAGDPVRITTQLLGHDGKRIHYFHRMYHRRAGFLAATNELLSLYVDMSARRVAVMPAQIRRRLAALATRQRVLPWPEQAGSVIGIPRGARRPVRAAN
jgi:acyl-CoA thioester hydrolase